MPTDAPDLSRFSCRNQMMFLQASRPVRFSGLRVCKDPIGPLCLRSRPCLVFQEQRGKDLVNWHPLLRIESLHIIFDPCDPGTLDSDSQIVPVKVAPFQSQGLAHAESETSGHDAHGPKRLGHELDELAKFLDR